MSDPFYYKSGQAGMWVQPDGPNTKPAYLGCHEMGDIEVPEGDLSPLFCPDAGQTDGFVIRDVTRGAPDIPSTELSVPVGKTLDYLEEWDCPGNILLLKQSAGRRDQITNWERAHLLFRASRTGRTYSAMGARTPDGNEESMVTVPFGFMTHSVLVKLRGVRLPVVSTVDLLTIAGLNDGHCWNGGPRKRRCDKLVVGGAGAVAVKAALEVSDDGGATWTDRTAAGPWAVAEDIGASAYIPYESGIDRILVGRSTTNADPAEIAYSDDEGATWTVVEVGAAAGRFITCMFALDRYHIWVGTDLGYIYFSDDGGATWTTQEAGVIAATDYLDISFVSPTHGVAVNEGNVVAVTVNGGRTWSAVTGPAAGDDLLSVAMVTENRWFIGTNAGELWCTENAGTTWAARTFSGSGAGEVQDIAFENEMVGFLAHDTVAPVGRVLRTKDGGYTWELETVPTNAGIAEIVVCGPNHVFAAGPDSGGTAYVAEVLSV